MENTEDAEKSTTVGDSAYSYSCSNSKSTRSSKSTLSGSNSSASSGYRGKRVNTDYNSKPNNVLSPPEKRTRDEVKTVEVTLKSPEIKNEVQPTVEFENPPSSNEDVKSGITDVYLTSPQASSGDGGKETDSMDISTSEKSVLQDSDTVYCVKKENSFESTLNEPHISHIFCTNYSNPLCSDGFFCVISMKDGIVMYTTLSISSVLGFPQDMWVGRSFTDFIHPNDRDAFVSQVSNDLTLWKKANASQLEKNASSMLCRIRRHKKLKSGFAIREKKSMFKPFVLKIFFKNIIDEDIIYLIIHAVSFAPAFKTANEKVIDPLPFVIKHSASGSLKYMDKESVSYLGYFPQDVEDKDKDMIAMYHPADLIYLHHVYETLLDVGSYDRCKPYRMQAYNGDYVKLESEWISYVHPWSKKLECIIGKHYVVEGPTNPNIFETPEMKKRLSYEEGETANSQILRDSIKRLLSKAVTKPTQLAKDQMTKKCQDIAVFMDVFIDMTKNETKEEELQEIKSVFQKSDSIKLGGLSSHNYTDSKSTTDTSISYDRLNYDETLQRYFDSHDAQCIANGYTNDGNLFKSTEISPENEASILHDPTAIPSTSSSPSSVTSQNHNIWLTESLLNKHNEKMEKKLVKIHRKSKSTTRGERSSKKSNLQKMNEHLNRCNETYEPTPPRRKVKRPKTQKRRHVKYTASARRKRAAENARKSSNTAILPCPWQANPGNSINTFLMGVGISQQKSFMNTITMPAAPVPLYYSTPLPTTAMPVNPGHQYGMFAGEQTVPYMMYGQALCGPYTYSPVNQLPQTLDDSCMREYMNQHTRPRSRESNEDSTDTSQCRAKKFKLGNSDGTVYNTDGESSFSSFYSSFFKTDSGSAGEAEETTVNKDDGKFWRRKLLVDDASSKDSRLHGEHARKRMQPPWLEHVCVTSELIYKYQITTKSLQEVLSADREKLTKLKQPNMVNEQLGQLYLDLQLEGVASRLTLEEGVTSSSSGEETQTAQSSKRRRSTDTRRRRGYSKMSILYDEDAPMPPPDDVITIQPSAT